MFLTILTQHAPKARGIFDPVLAWAVIHGDPLIFAHKTLNEKGVGGLGMMAWAGDRALVAKKSKNAKSPKRSQNA